MYLLFLRDYVRSELESGYEGPMYLEPLSMNRFMTALIGECAQILTSFNSPFPQGAC